MMPSSQRSYDHTIRVFIEWYGSSSGREAVAGIEGQLDRIDGSGECAHECFNAEELTQAVLFVV
jgi:hypothetical protein